MSRLPYPDPAAIPANVKALLDARPPRNVFRMLANAPALMPGLMELTGAILYRAKLDPVSRELAILRVGSLCGSHYEVEQHRKIAAAIGLSAEQIDSAINGKGDVLLEFVEQVVRKTKADDALFQKVVTTYGAEQTIELLVIIGTYVMLAQVLENAGVELEAGAGPKQEDVEKIFGKQKK